jgi:hypothetical protein
LPYHGTIEPHPVRLRFGDDFQDKVVDASRFGCEKGLIHNSAQLIASG